jgi:hypothetical protein
VTVTALRTLSDAHTKQRALPLNLGQPHLERVLFDGTLVVDLVLRNIAENRTESFSRVPRRLAERPAGDGARRESASKVTGAEEPRRHSAGQGMLLPGSGLTDRGWSDGLAGRQGQLTRGRWSTQYRWRRPGAGSSTGTCSQPPQTARARSAGVSGIPGRERGGRRALPHRSLRELLHSWSGGMLRSFRATRVPALRAFRRLLSYALLRA